MPTVALLPWPSITMEDRELINIDYPEIVGVPTRHFAIALDNEEAQEYLRQGFRVFGDDEGPYLVIRLQHNQSWPLHIPRKYEDPDFLTYRRKATVKFQPRPYTYHQHTGVICWLEEIT